MKRFKFYWIYSSLFLILGCSGFQTKPYSFSDQKNDFVAEYCQSGKQKKAFKKTVIYVTPKLGDKLPLDKANDQNKKLAEQKNEMLKKLFYLLANEKMSDDIVNHGDKPNWYLLVSDNEADVLKNIEEEQSDANYRLFTFIIKILNRDKIIVYQSNQSSRKMNYDKGYSTDLNRLINEYTILAPKEVIEKMTDAEFDSGNLYDSLILNENGEVDISKAIDRKNHLWKAYISKFSSIKEATEDNSRKSTVEVSLDLNTFCRYGRKISDLQSQ